MKNAKLLHTVQIAVLILLTAVVSAAVVRIGRTVPVSAPAATSASLSEAAQPMEESLQTTETEWLPEIEYDAYTTSEIVQENFRSTVVLGNSQAQALSNFGLVRNADFVTRVGLSILNVLTSKDGNPPITKLYGKQYQKAIFIFGENELGWPYPENFISHYKKVIAKVRELNPGVEIYCQAIFPVSAKVSATNTNGVTNENVRIFNALIRKMCDEIDATFMPVSDAFFDRTGALPEGVAFDGVHFGYDYCKIWAGDMSAYLQANAPETTELIETTELPQTAESDAPTETMGEGVTEE